MDPKPDSQPASPSEAGSVDDCAEAWPAPTSDPEDSHGEGLPDAVRLEGEPIGAYLAAQRRLRGITVAELAAQTRIPLRSLERLEGGAFDANVDGFVRGFVRTVALALGLDPEETVARTLSEPGEGSAAGPGQHLSLRRVFLTVAFIVGAALMLGLVQTVVISRPDDSGPVLDLVVVRRDPVAALAEVQAVAGLSRSVPRVRVRPRPVASEERSAAPKPASHVTELSQPAVRSR
jgi:hypothetical protein